LAGGGGDDGGDGHQEEGSMMDAATPLPDFDEVRRAIEKAGREAMLPDSENRQVLFEQAIRDVLEIRADAMRSGIYFKDPEVKLKAYETRCRAERRLAQFLMAMDEAGLRDPGHPKKGEKGRKASVPSGLPRLMDFGVDRRQSQDWQKLARMSDAEFEAWLETEKSQRRSRRRKGPVDYPLHPITDEYDEFTEPEFAALRQSLREHGRLLVAIVIWREQTVDGKHRTKACKEEGIPRRYRDITDLCPTEEEMRAHVRALNEHRRANTKPLKTAEKQARVEAALKIDPERSDRAIAEEVGVSQPTVSDRRKKLQDEGVIKSITPSERKSQTGKKGEGQRRREPQKGGISAKAAKAFYSIGTDVAALFDIDDNILKGKSGALTVPKQVLALCKALKRADTQAIWTAWCRTSPLDHRLVAAYARREGCDGHLAEIFTRLDSNLPLPAPEPMEEIERAHPVLQWRHIALNRGAISNNVEGLIRVRNAPDVDLGLMAASMLFVDRQAELARVREGIAFLQTYEQALGGELEAEATADGDQTEDCAESAAIERATPTQEEMPPPPAAER
jgi:DNA-binding Lrp family transcriptional regulator